MDSWEAGLCRALDRPRPCEGLREGFLPPACPGCVSKHQPGKPRRKRRKGPRAKAPRGGAAWRRRALAVLHGDSPGRERSCTAVGGAPAGGTEGERAELEPQVSRFGVRKGPQPSVGTQCRTRKGCVVASPRNWTTKPLGVIHSGHKQGTLWDSGCHRREA